MDYRGRVTKLAAFGLIIIVGVAAGRLTRSLADGPALPVLTTAEEVFAAEAGTKQLLFIARSDCGACDMTKPLWEELAANTPSTALIRHITSTSDRGPGSTLDVDGVRYESATRDALRSTGIEVVPTTVVIDRTGEIALLKVGPLTTTDMEAIVELLN